MAFDDKKLGPVFPTHPAIPFDHTIEEGMISAVGGASGIRSRIYMNGDGDKTFLKTRSGHPILRTEKKKKDPSPAQYGEGDIVCIPSYLATSPDRVVGFGYPFSLDGNGKSTAATDGGDHPVDMFPRKLYNAAEDVWRWPEMSDELQLTVDPVYGKYAARGTVRMLDENFDELPPSDICVSWGGEDKTKLCCLGRAVLDTYVSSLVFAVVVDAVIYKDWVYVAVTLQPEIQTSVDYRLYKARFRLRSTGLVELTSVSSKDVTEVSVAANGFPGPMCIRPDAEVLAIRHTQDEVKWVDILDWGSTFPVTTIDVSDLCYNTFAATTVDDDSLGLDPPNDQWPPNPYPPNGTKFYRTSHVKTSSTNSADSKMLQRIDWFGNTLRGFVQEGYFVGSWSVFIWTKYEYTSGLPDNEIVEYTYENYFSNIATGRVILVPFTEAGYDLNSARVIIDGGCTSSSAIENYDSTVQYPPRTVDITTKYSRLLHYDADTDTFIGVRGDATFSGDYDDCPLGGDTDWKFGILRSGEVAVPFKTIAAASNVASANSKLVWLPTLTDSPQTPFPNMNGAVLSAYDYEPHRVYGTQGQGAWILQNMVAVYGTRGRIGVLWDTYQQNPDFSCAILYSRGNVYDIPTLVGEAGNCGTYGYYYLPDSTIMSPVRRWAFGVI